MKLKMYPKMDEIMICYFSALQNVFQNKMMFEFEWKYAQINQQRKNSETAIVERGIARAGCKEFPGTILIDKITLLMLSEE